MTVDVEHKLDLLAALAEVQDAEGFARAVKSIDWDNQHSEDTLRAVNLALEAGAYLTARELSALGASLFPDNAELRKFAETLAPARIIARRAAQGQGIRANRDWLKEHSEAYRGKWIGLRDGTLVAVAESLDELKNSGVIAKNTLITRVYFCCSYSMTARHSRHQPNPMFQARLEQETLQIA